MEKCKNCQVNDAVKYSKYSNGDFCSRACARAYSTKENRTNINIAVSKSLKGRKVGGVFPSKKLEDNNIIKIIDIDKIKKIKENRTKLFNDKILNAEFSTLSYERLRKRIILEQNNKCNKCGLSKWLDVPLPLELEHIDGNHHNNSRENLEALCPNCHALTPTWRGRNKTTNKKKISDDTLLEALIRNNFNFRQSLIFVGLAPKGGNYKRCHKLKKEFDGTDFI
jgi:5-methylcytosine-specific restriction endonuclease McrA